MVRVEEPVRLTATVARRYFYPGGEIDTSSKQQWQWEIKVLELGILHEARSDVSLDRALDTVGGLVQQALVSEYDHSPEFILVVS